MTERALRLLDEARKLTPEERELIALELLEGDGETHDVVEAAWGDEIARRVREIDDGTAKTIALEDVLAEIDARLARRTG